jgi:hypothetical protein
MRAIHTIALCRSSRSYAGVRREARPKTKLGFGLGGLPSLSRRALPSLNAGPGTGCRSMTAGDSSMATSLPCTAKSTSWPIRFTRFLRASRQLFKTSPVSMSRPVSGRKLFRSQRSRRTWPSAADTRPTKTRHPGSLLAESSISAGAATFASGVGSPLRGEARDFYSGSPDYNVASLSGRQHNVFAGGAGRAIPPVCDPAFQN